MASPESCVPIGRVLKQIRETRGLTQGELARRTGIDHRTITAIETRRILNPSLLNLKRLAQALGITLKELFARTEAEAISSLFIGTQKGEYRIELPENRARLISYLPPSFPLFAAKLILNGRGRIDEAALPLKGSVFLQIVLGKLEVNLEGRESLLREGQNCFFDGRLSYSLTNPLWREATSLIFAAAAPDIGTGFMRKSTAS